MASFSSTIKHYFNVFASRYRWQQLSEWYAQIFQFDLSQKQQSTERFWSFWMFCRGLQNAEMPLCACAHTGWWKATGPIFCPIKRVREGQKQWKPQNAIRSFATFLWCLWNPLLSICYSPLGPGCRSVLCSANPAHPSEARLSEQCMPWK